MRPFSVAAAARLRALALRVARAAPFLVAIAAPAGAPAALADDAPRTLTAIAECTGPHGAFRTTVHSAHDGRMRLVQEWPDGRTVSMGIDAEGTWGFDEWLGSPVPQTAPVTTFLRGHEFHALALWPASRLGEPVRRTRVREDGRPLERREYRDALGAPVRIDVDARTHRLHALHLANPGPEGAREVLAVAGDWRPAGGREALHRVAITHGEELWEYRFTSVVFDTASAASFARPRARTDREQLLALHESALRAHRRGDVEELLAPEADDYSVGSRGAIEHPRKDERRARFGEYLGRTRFHEYRDLVPPEVRLSADGTLGWVLVQVRGEGVQSAADSSGTPRPLAFTSAWIELYEKRDGRWWRTGNVSNFLP